MFNTVLWFPWEVDWKKNLYLQRKVTKMKVKESLYFLEYFFFYQKSLNYNYWIEYKEINRLIHRWGLPLSNNLELVSPDHFQYRYNVSDSSIYTAFISPFVNLYLASKLYNINVWRYIICFKDRTIWSNSTGRFCVLSQDWPKE